jgi:hypothetical protein
MDNLTLPDTRTRFPDWLFWLSWVAASTAAILLGFGILYGLIFLAKAILPGVNEDMLFGGLVFPVLAALLGIFQWLVLRTRIPKAGWWVPATTVGMLIGIALGVGMIPWISRLTGRTWDWDYQPNLLGLYAIIGLTLALVQLLVLRRHVTASWLWLPVTMVGWGVLGLLMGKSIDRMSDIFALGAVPGVFTGLGLLWLLRRPRT